MSDLETLKEMLDRAEVIYTEQDWPLSDKLVKEIIINARTGSKNLGYSDFYSEFVFNEAGKLDHVGVWE